MHLRVAILCLLALPTAGAVSASISAPGPVPVDGTPFAVRVELDELPPEAVEVKAWLGGEGFQASRTWNGTAFERSDRYVLELDPGAHDGRWSGWIPMQANPGSRNHDRLLDEQPGEEGGQGSGAQRAPLLGVRVRDRGGALAEATVPVEPMGTPEHRLATAGPGQALVVQDATGDAVARRAHPADEVRVVDVAVPAGFQGTVCPLAGCPAGEGLVLDRVGPAFARVRNTGLTAVSLATGVVVLEEGICPVNGTLAPGATLTVEPEPADGDGDGAACRGGGSSAGWQAGTLWWRGQRVDQAPDPPGWGDVVRRSWGDQGFAPWRLPRGVEPAPVEPMRVRGAVDAFATRSEGLDAVRSVIREARERLSVATYVFTNERVADALVAAERRGVEVTLLLEPTPVGGLPASEQAIVRRLEAAGAEVRWFGGAIHEHGLQHAKVIVADGAVCLVLTENLTYSGLPVDGEGNLGLGLGVANATLARRLEALLGFEPGATRAWTPTGWQALDAPVTVLTSPENTWRIDGVPVWLADAGRVDGLALSVSPDWGARPNAWLTALADAASQRPVRILASGLPAGAREDNRLGLAVVRGDPDARHLSARLSSPATGTVHAKALIGSNAALVGSSNWGMGGVLLNREVNLLVEDPRVAAELGSVFDRAWNGTGSVGSRLPVGAGPWVLAPLVLAGVARGARCVQRDPRGLHERSAG